MTVDRIEVEGLKLPVLTVSALYPGFLADSGRPFVFTSDRVSRSTVCTLPSNGMHIRTATKEAAKKFNFLVRRELCRNRDVTRLLQLRFTRKQVGFLLLNFGQSLIDVSEFIRHAVQLLHWLVSKRTFVRLHEFIHRFQALNILF